MRHTRSGLTALWGLAGALLVLSSPVHAQQRISTGQGQGTGTSFGGGNSFSGSSGGVSGSGGSFSGSGGSFSGSGSGGSFSGSGGSFSGSGGSFSGSGSGGAAFSGSTGGTFRTGAANMNSVGGTSVGAGFYYSPLTMGLPFATGTATFGNPIYNYSSTGTGGLGTRQTGGAGLGTRAGANTGLAGRNTGTLQNGSATIAVPFASSVGIRRAPAYTTDLGWDYKPVVAPRTATNLQQVIARSNGLPSRDTIQVVMDGEVVVLKGSVASEREGRLAEAMVRLSPGIRELRNELQIQETAPAPRRQP